jgi:hypothetical protein
MFHRILPKRSGGCVGLDTCPDSLSSSCDPPLNFEEFGAPTTSVECGSDNGQRTSCQEYPKRFCHRGVALFRVTLILIAVMVGSGSAATNSSKSNNKNMKQEYPFSNFVWYRRSPVVRYITNYNKAWKYGRRDILVWGSGGGGELAMALREQGANQVTFLDGLASKSHTVGKKIQDWRRLSPPLDHSTLPPQNQFDLVVSYMGALTICSCSSSSSADVGTFPPNKVVGVDSRKAAMEGAFRACREDGFVLLAECDTANTLTPAISIPILLAISVLIRLGGGGYLVARWKMALLAVGCYLINGTRGGAIFLFAQLRVCRDVVVVEEAKKKILSRLSLVVLCLVLKDWITWSGRQWKRDLRIRGEMERVGLTDIQVTERPCLFVLERLLGETTFSQTVTRYLTNMAYYPGMVIVYQGKKARRESVEQ